MVETFVQSTDDVVAFLKDQHNLIKDMFDEVCPRRTRKRARRRSSTCVSCWRCTRPPRRWWFIRVSAARSTAGDEIVDARLNEEHEAKEQLSKLESMDIGSQEFIDALTQVPRRGRSTTPSARRPRSSTSCGGSSTPTSSSGWHRSAGRRGHRADPPPSGCGVGEAELHRRAVRVDGRPGPRCTQAGNFVGKRPVHPPMTGRRVSSCTSPAHGPELGVDINVAEVSCAWYRSGKPNSDTPVSRSRVTEVTPGTLVTNNYAWRVLPCTEYLKRSTSWARLSKKRAACQ